MSPKLFGFLHHHRFLAAVCEGEHKPSVIVNGNALYDGAEAAVLPFGVEEVKFAKLKEESAELVRLELLILPLPCESRITLLQGLVSFGKALIAFSIEPLSHWWRYGMVSACGASVFR